MVKETVKRIKRKLQILYREFVIKRHGGVINRFDTHQKFAALTFDDGPHPIWTPKIRDLLADHNAKATFFVLGENAAKYSQIIEELIADGHSIGNHSWNHPSFPEISKSQQLVQLRSCEEVIGNHNSLKLFRPPYGHLNKKIRLRLFQQGYKVITWNVVANDWEKGIDSSAMYEKVASKIKPGSIILLHDSLFEFRESDRSEVLLLLDKILKEFGNEYQFLTIPQLMKQLLPVYCYWDFSRNSKLVTHS